MPIEKTFKTTGVFATWDWDAATFAQSDVKAEFVAAGLGRYAPHARTDLACLSLALAHLYARRSDGTEAVRVEPTGNDGYVVNVVRPDPTKRVAPTAHMLAAWLEDSGTPDAPRVLRVDDPARYNEIKDEMDRAAQCIDGGAVSKALVNALRGPEMQGFPLRRHGGVYWLPDGSDGRWRALAAGIERASNGSARCYSVTTVADFDSVRTVSDAFVRDMDRKLKAAEEVLLEPDLDREKLDDAAMTLTEYGELADKHAALLGVSMAEITARLEEMRVRASQAAMLLG